MKRCLRYLWPMAFAVVAVQAAAGEVTIAVAANFLPTAKVLAEKVQAATGDEVRLAHGSTGRLYAQILAGAPFDIFLSADAERPRLLEEAGLTEARSVYALGRLVLVSRDPLVQPGAPERAFAGKRVVLADPAVAPYGIAAEEVMAATGMAEGAELMIRVDSVGQVAGVLVTGNADAGFLAASQAATLPNGPWTVVPLDAWHAPILQEAVLLRRAADNAAAGRVFEFLGSEAARQAISDAGYGVIE